MAGLRSISTLTALGNSGLIRADTEFDGRYVLDESGHLSTKQQSELLEVSADASSTQVGQTKHAQGTVSTVAQCSIIFVVYRKMPWRCIGSLLKECSATQAPRFRARQSFGSFPCLWKIVTSHRRRCDSSCWQKLMSGTYSSQTTTLPSLKFSTWLFCWQPCRFELCDFPGVGDFDTFPSTSLISSKKIRLGRSPFHYNFSE